MGRFLSSAFPTDRTVTLGFGVVTTRGTFGAEIPNIIYRRARQTGSLAHRPFVRCFHSGLHFCDCSKGFERHGHVMKIVRPSQLCSGSSLRTAAAQVCPCCTGSEGL